MKVGGFISPTFLFHFVFLHIKIALGGIYLCSKIIKKQSMLSAARKLFSEQGFKNSSMQQIADEAGVGVATLFRYFPKKDLLIVDVITEVIHEMVPIFEAIDALPNSGYDKMEKIIDAYIDYIFSANREAVTLLENFEFYIMYNTIEEELLQMIRLAYLRIGKLIQKTIDVGIKDGSIHLNNASQDTFLTIMNLFGTAIKKQAMVSFLPTEIVPVPKKTQLIEVKKLLLNYLKHGRS